MRNPWHELPNQAPYVLPSDAPQVDAFNIRNADRDSRLLRLDIRPEPFIGSLEAPIVLLLLNPGYSPDDVRLHSHPTGQSLWQCNLQQSPSDYPFYMLNPDIAWAPGARWWSERLKHLVAFSDARTVATSLLVVEYFPYHTRQDPRFPGSLPSQQFGFHVVGQAMDRGALVLISRSGRAWREQIPGLSTYPLAYQARSPQQSRITPANYPDAFPHIMRVLSAGVSNHHDVT